MKKLNMWLALGFVAMASVLVYAGNQYNWGTSTGGNWVTPDNTAVVAGQALQIGASGGAVIATTPGPLSIMSASSTTINALTPATTGQIVFCNNCLTAATLCVSTGVLTSQWALLPSSGTNKSCQ